MNKLSHSLLALGTAALLAGSVGAAEALLDQGSASAPSPKPDHEAILVMLHLPPPHFRPDSSYAGPYADDAGHGARRRIASELARHYGLKLLNDWPMPALGVDCYVMQAPEQGPPTSALLEQLAQDARVAWVEPMRQFHGLGQNDPLYPVQPAAKFWHLAELHRVSTGRNVTVAVIDSGVDARHPDLRGQFAFNENLVDAGAVPGEAHGTAVAGVIAARAGNGIGIEGVAPDARLMALRACWQAPDLSTQCNSFTLGKALNFAILHKAQVINMSWSGPADRLLQRLLDVALQHGIHLVGAIDPQAPAGGFPAAHPGVLAVSERAAASVDNALQAPGRDVPSTAPGGRWSFVSGSSYAAAHVAGLVALLSELRPALSAAQLRQTIVLAPLRPAAAGANGSIDACATIGIATRSCPCSCATVHAATASDYR